MYLHGVPVAINENIATTTGATSIYCFDRNEVVGLVNEDEPDILTRQVEAAHWSVSLLQHPGIQASLEFVMENGTVVWRTITH